MTGRKTIGIVGARGHTGAELIRLIARHPALALAFVSSRELDGERVSDHVDAFNGALRYENLGPEAVAVRGADAVILALPNGKSADYVKLLGARHVGFGCDFVAAYKASKRILPASVRWRTLRPDIFGTVDEFVSQSYPEGLTEIRELPNFTQKLFDRGNSEQDIAAIMGGNWLRIFRQKYG